MNPACIITYTEYDNLNVFFRNSEDWRNILSRLDNTESKRLVPIFASRRIRYSSLHSSTSLTGLPPSLNQTLPNVIQTSQMPSDKHHNYAAWHSKYTLLQHKLGRLPPQHHLAAVTQQVLPLQVPEQQVCHQEDLHTIIKLITQIFFNN